MFHPVILFMEADNLSWVLATERCNYVSPAAGLWHCREPGSSKVGGAGGSCPVHALWAVADRYKAADRIWGATLYLLQSKWDSRVCMHNSCGTAHMSHWAGGVEGDEGSCKVPFIASMTALEASLPLLQYQRAVVLISSLSYTLLSYHRD